MFAHLHLMLAIPLFMASMVVQDKDAEDDSWNELPSSTIEVRLKGELRTAARTEGRAVVELRAATVSAGETDIILDWQGSKAIHDELLWWSMPRHGDLSRVVQAEITGVLVFRSHREAKGMITPFEGLGEKTPVPVVLVDSLRVQLADQRTGQPTGPQHDRPRVYRVPPEER